MRKTLIFLLCFLWTSPLFAQTASPRVGTAQIQRKPLAQLTLKDGELGIATDQGAAGQLYAGRADGSKILIGPIPVNFTIGTVTTGSPASATITGTLSNPVLNLVIPPGQTVVGPQGIQGVAGPIGATGPAGKDGKDGAPGVAGQNGTNGTNGTAATIAVGTVTTLAPGSNATFTNTGTANAAVFNVGLPRGNPGADGAVGATGPSGIVTATAPLTYNATTKTVAIDAATTTTAGSMSAADKTKLNALTFTSITDGSAAIPALGIGAGADVTVTWTTPLSGTVFTAYPTIVSGSINISNVSVSVKSVTSTGCVVRVTNNNGLLTLSVGTSLVVLGTGK